MAPLKLSNPGLVFYNFFVVITSVLQLACVFVTVIRLYPSPALEGKASNLTS
jgi:hypothetical protein